MSVLQDLYDSEINFAVSTFWDDGFLVQLDDGLNGFKAETKVRRWDEVEPWLTKAAIEHFPDSVFAMMYRDGMSRFQAALRTKQ
jgi:hypothetical protein